ARRTFPRASTAACSRSASPADAAQLRAAPGALGWLVSWYQMVMPGRLRLGSWRIHCLAARPMRGWLTGLPVETRNQLSTCAHDRLPDRGASTLQGVCTVFGREVALRLGGRHGEQSVRQGCRGCDVLCAIPPVSSQRG